MRDNNFVNIAIATFQSLQKKYNLKLKSEHDILNYSNAIVSFSVYFERSFELYVCFHFQNTDLRLNDIAKYLGFDNNDIDLINRNQIASKTNIGVILENLCSILKKVLDMLFKNPERLTECIQNQKRIEQARQLTARLASIQQAWENKDFEKFLELVESNRENIEKTSRAKMIFKQEVYAKKHRDRLTIKSQDPN